MPRTVANVAVAAVSNSDWRNSASPASAPTPRAPPATTRPATGPTMKRRNSDAIVATTMDAAARDAVKGRGADDVGRSSLAAVPTAEGGGSSGAVHDGRREQVDVRVADLFCHRRGEQISQETVGSGGVGRLARHGHAVENRLALDGRRRSRRASAHANRYRLVFLLTLRLAQIHLRGQHEESKSVRPGHGLVV